MMTIQIKPENLVKMRFAYRPLLEIPLSYRVFINPEFQSPYQRWMQESNRALYGLDLPYLDALVTGHGYIPDFLTPTPNGKHTDIEADLEALLATPDDLIREGMLTMIEEQGDSGMRRFFLAHPREAVRCLVEDLRLYWQQVLAHYWSRMVSALEGDVLHRARLLALDGPGPMFTDLHSSIDFEDTQIRIRPICQHVHNDIDLSLGDEGLQLVPVIFRGCGRMVQVAPGFQSMLAYGVRGAGLWYQKATSNQSLELALGTGRARVLEVLKTPATNGEVAHKTRSAPATASHHLSRLTKSGLVEPRRSGKRVYYYLTARGLKLLTLFEAGD